MTNHPLRRALLALLLAALPLGPAAAMFVPATDGPLMPADPPAGQATGRQIQFAPLNFATPAGSLQVRAPDRGEDLFVLQALSPPLPGSTAAFTPEIDYTADVFAGATADATRSDPVQVIAEPAALLLFGAALVSLALGCRSRPLNARR